MSISLLNWRDNPGNIRIQNPDLLTPCLTEVNNSAIAANYNSWGQSCSTWDIMSIIDKNLRIPIYNGNSTLYPDSYLISNSSAKQWRNNNFGTGLQTGFSANAVVLDYMPRLHIELMSLRDYLDQIQPTSTPFTWAYNTGLFIANDTSDRGWHFNRESYGDFYDKSSGYYVVKTISWYTNNNDGSAQTLLSSGGISSNQSNQSYLCKYDVGIPLTITKNPQSTSPIKSDYILGYYSRFFARPAIALTSDDNIYGCGLYTNAGLHQVMLKGAGNMISPEWYWGGSTSGYSYTRRPTALIRYATKEVWERLLNGGGCAWSYDLDVVTSPDGNGLNEPTTPGQPENPVVTGDGTGDNISDKVLYPSPAYIPNATVYDRYFLTPNQMPNIKKFLFSDTFVDNIKRLWTNPAEYVISLVCYPFDVDSTGLTTTSGVVSVGGVSSDISAAALTDKGVPYFYGGSVMVDNYYNSYLDYEPYTSIDIYIPYIGVRPLNVSQVVGHTLCIGYYIDLNTQQITALIGLDGQGGNLGQVVTQFVGSIGIQTPLSGTSAQDMIRNIVAQTSGLITGVGAIAGGIMGANPALLASGVASTSNALLGGGHTAPSYYGSLSPVSGLYTPQVAYLIINRPRQAMPAAYLTQQGFSSNYSGKVSQFSGYLECASVNIASSNTMTAQEQQEIINLLTGGIYCG